ncbi:chb [Bugula neritina]|uniref:beta-N-acetylhexosaminidase n=1 Tax=Bugula neritina TaxID=10212 RepID=A0A7J7K6C1_BUGNE|nr:chb [Bugula neritina]
MWRYRLNSLHLHLTDDESWAIEIEDIPELTMYGSRQCFNLSECGNYPQLGRELTNSKQYLSKSEYIEIVQFADSLDITVIPEIELPDMLLLPYKL